MVSPNQKIPTPFQQLLENNDMGVIENPLERIEEKDLNKNTATFHTEYSLGPVVDVETLKRGGRLARSERRFRRTEILGEVEEAALEKEGKTRFWEESKELRTILLTCTMGGMTQGWVQGAIVGANQLWPAAFGLHIGSITHTEVLSSTADIWKFGATNAITYFAASFAGALLCDPLTEIFVGRRGALFVAAITTLTASIGSAFTHDWRALFLCRAVLGIGMGAKSSVVPVYLSEVSPARLRGQILTSWQTTTALGIAASATVCLIVPHSWQFQIASSFIPAALLLVLVFVGSESPRWLAKKRRYADAYKVLLRLRGSPLLASRDLVHIRAQLDVETLLFTRKQDQEIPLGNELPHIDVEAYNRETSLTGYGRRITQLFTIPRVRRSTLASFVVMTSQQLSGVNIFAFLAATLFSSAGFSDKKSLWLFFGFGVSNFVFSPIGYFFIDRKGRRSLLMASLATMVPLLIATAFSFDATNNSVQVAVVATFVILYTLAYSPGAGVVPFLYSSEIFPQVLREVGMAWASAIAFIGAGLLALTVPQLINALGATRLLGLFAGLDAIALLCVWLVVPGTEQQIATMEEMNYVFGVPTQRLVRYQLYEVLPWYFKTYVQRQSLKPLAPLYRYSQLIDEAQAKAVEGKAVEGNGVEEKAVEEKAVEEKAVEEKAVEEKDVEEKAVEKEDV